ncbi:MAG: LysR family transcriptional regulator [Subtercola sp.]|nr:LysR family transcriptional regulator [Subtercola sp.]
MGTDAVGTDPAGTVAARTDPAGTVAARTDPAGTVAAGFAALAELARTFAGSPAGDAVLEAVTRLGEELERGAELASDSDADARTQGGFGDDSEPGRSDRGQGTTSGHPNHRDTATDGRSGHLGYHDTATPTEPLPFEIHSPTGLSLTALAQRFAAEHPGLAVTVVESEFATPHLRAGTAAVALVRLPAFLNGLQATPVLTEPFVVAVAADDRLASRESVDVSELADRHLLHNPDEVPEWRDVATELLGLTIRTSQSFALGPLATLDEQLAHVAAGDGIIIVPRSRAASRERADVALVVVADIPVHTVVLAHRSETAAPDPTATGSPTTGSPTTRSATKRSATADFARLAASAFAS